MPALKRRVMAVCRVHNIIKARLKAMIGQGIAIIYSNECFAWLIHSSLKVGQRLAVDGYSSVSAGLSLAVTDDKITLFELNVRFKDGQKLTRPRSAIYHHYNSLRPA